MPQSDSLIPVVITAVVNAILNARAGEISGQTRRFEPETQQDWVVVANKVQYPISLIPVAHGFEVTYEDKIYRIQTDWLPGSSLVEVEVNGQQVTLQLDAHKAGYISFHRGAETELLVLTPHAAALAQHMIEKVPPDMSKFLLSPMPGLLVHLSVAEGDEVKAGEELAVVEAMKMENSLRAEVDGVVTKVLANEGESLMVDQPIVEFE